MKDVMIDVETFGKKSSSAIVQIGACYFDRETGEIGETLSININYNNDSRFTFDYDTVSWWLSQSDEARKSITGNTVSIETAIASNLIPFLGKYPGLSIWSHATFDVPILMHAFDKLGLEFPVNYKNMRDIRTLIDISDYKIPWNARTGVHHSALDDCRFQVKYCVAALKKNSGVEVLRTSSPSILSTEVPNKEVTLNIK